MFVLITLSWCDVHVYMVKLFLYIMYPTHECPEMINTNMTSQEHDEHQKVVPL